MNPSKSLCWKSVIAIAVLAAALPSFAQKRRSVQHPGGAAVPFESVTVTGTVVDAVTGKPVYLANVRVGARSDNTDKAGKFRLVSQVAGTGTITISRSGYTAVEQSITPGTHEVNVRVQPTPTVTLRLKDGTIHNIDNESVEFGFVPPFGSYEKAESDDFCRPNGTSVALSRTDFKRIIGPATTATNSACCPERPLQKINAQLKSGETTDLFFVDSCLGYSIDFIGRDHAAGTFVYTKFSDVAEIIFP